MLKKKKKRKKNFFLNLLKMEEKITLYNLFHEASINKNKDTTRKLQINILFLNLHLLGFCLGHTSKI
jgi:hypothetical protein